MKHVTRTVETLTKGTLSVRISRTLDGDYAIEGTDSRGITRYLAVADADTLDSDPLLAGQV